MGGWSRLGRMAGIAIVCLWALTGTTRAAGPVALILEMDGAMEPPVEAFSELLAGDTVRLSDAATLMFLHYPSCAEVTVRGGRLVLSDQRYTLQGGKIVAVDRARCPKTVVLSENRQVGGVLIRSGGASIKLAPRPEFVVVGPQLADIAKVRIRDGDRVLAERALKGAVFEWPDDAPELAPKGGETGYVAEMLDAAGQVLQSLEFAVKASGGRPQVTVVRLK